MCTLENEKTAKILEWIYGNPTNTAIWDIIRGDGELEYTVGECIDMISKTAEAEMYQFALILIFKLYNCIDLREAVINVITRRMIEAEPDFGVITACINEFKRIAEQKGIMNKKIQEYV